MNVAHCRENHIPPPDYLPAIPKYIGTDAGYAAYGEFLDGDYGLPSENRDQIDALNAAYQSEYDDLHLEAVGLWEWLNEVHAVPDLDVQWVVKAGKTARLREIDAEIDGLWNTLTLAVRNLIPESCINLWLGL